VDLMLSDLENNFFLVHFKPNMPVRECGMNAGFLVVNSLISKDMSNPCVLTSLQFGIEGMVIRSISLCLLLFICMCVHVLGVCVCVWDFYQCKLT